LNFLQRFQSCKWLFAIALLWVSFPVFSTQSVHIAPIPDWIVSVVPGGKAPSAKQFSDGHYVAFTDRQIHLDKQTSYSRIIRHIASETGVQNGSEFSVAFDPTYERIDFHTIIVWRDGKAMSRLNPAAFKIMALETDRQRFIYNGYYEASVVLKDIRKGDRIEFAWSRIGWNPIFQNKFSSTLSFSGPEYLPHVHYALFSGKGHTPRFKEFNNAPQSTQRIQQGTTIYEWDLKNVEAVKYEDYSPSWYHTDPYIQVSEYKNWSEVAEWGVGFYAVPKVGGALKAKIEQWKRDAESQHRYIELATRFVQDEIRYLGIETGENSHRPHDPETVFTQRYGDCKDKAFLLCAILSANGIDCDPVLVNTYRQAHLNECLPSPTQFNHVVVRIRDSEKRFIFIDATYSLQGGTASTTFFPYYGEGLVLKQGGRDLISMSDRNMGAVDITEEVFLRPRKDTASQSQLLVKTVYHGSQADAMRSNFQGMNVSTTEEEYLNYYKELFKGTQVEPIDSIEYYDQRDANTFSVMERYVLPTPWVFDSTRKNHYFHIAAKMLYNQLIILPDRKRKEPVSLPFPYAMNYTIRIHFDGYKHISAEDWLVERGSYRIRFTSKINEHEKAWDLCYEFQLLKDHVPVGDVSQFKDDINRLVKSMDYEIRDSQTGGSISDDLNYWMVGVVLLSFALSLILFRKLNRYSPGSRFWSGSGISFGGWLIILAITLIPQPFAMLISLADDYPVYFTESGWVSLNGRSALDIMLFHLLLVVETVVNVLLFCGSIFLIFLFVGKRDSFPRMFTIYFIVKLLVMVADTMASVLLFDFKISEDTYGELGRLFIYCVIWISYVNTSARIENTFVNEYQRKASDETSFTKGQNVEADS
jgi:hypothetical protein